MQILSDSLFQYTSNHYHIGTLYWRVLIFLQQNICLSGQAV